MSEDEEATFYFPRRYLVGDAPLVTPDGRLDDSDRFIAHVHLMKAVPLADIPDSPIRALPAPEESGDKKAEEKGADARFGLHQLEVGEKLLSEKKTGMARRAFNRARMAWTGGVDLATAPSDFVHPMLEKSPEEIRKWVDSRALGGVARSFLANSPPQKTNAIAKLREAIEIDPDFDEAVDMLRELGVDIADDAFPPFSDPRLATHQFWMRDKVPWEKRVEFATFTRQEGAALFAKKQYEKALAAYNRAQAAFAGQNRASLPEDRGRVVAEHIATNRLNMLACFLELGQFLQVVVNAKELIEFLNKTGQTAPKMKCLYRLARAYLGLDKDETAEEVILQLQGISGSEQAVADLRSMINERKRAHQVEMDLIYKKMMSTE
jgi:tetratricopeptide (TPR) repeat protein